MFESTAAVQCWCELVRVGRSQIVMSNEWEQQRPLDSGFWIPDQRLSVELPECPLSYIPLVKIKVQPHVILRIDRSYIRYS